MNAAKTCGRLLLLTLWLAMAGCASDDAANSALDELVASMDPDQRMADPQPAGSIDITMREVAGADADALTQIANVEAFWIDTGSEIGLTYEPLDSARLFPRSTLADIGPVSCTASDQSLELTAELTSFNAVVANCPQEGITVLWDDIDLKAFLDRNFPEAGFAQLIAHEWGHVVQNQLEPVERSTLLEEQQADCYAGAYMRWAESTGTEPFTNPRARDLAVLSILESRDQVGASPTGPNAHGNGFDRIRAAQEGYDEGVAFCAGYDEAAPPVTQMAFTTEDEAAMGGNLPFDRTVALLDPAIAAHFQSLTDEPIDPFVQLPGEAVLGQQHAAIGDGAVAALLGLSYAGAVQLAADMGTAGVPAALQRACLLGTFLNRALAGDLPVDAADGTSLRLSPGDLDEIITSLTNSPAVLANPGLVFEMVSAVRIGTIDGPDGCGMTA